MGYITLINSSLNTAFKQLKDLAITAELIKSEDKFDFDTQSVKSTREIETVQLIKISEVKKSKDQKTFTCELLINNREIGDLKRADSLKFEGHTWKIGEVLRNTGYVVLCSASRESI